jgi:hypothetical protein
MRLLNTTLAAGILMASLPEPVAAQVPEGWIKGGRAPQQYDVGIDKTVQRGGHPVVFVKSIEGAEKCVGALCPFGTLMQMASPGEYLGKRVRYSADVKSESIDQEDWAGLWFRVDGPDSGPGKTLAFDNMQDRPIKGTTDWKRVSIVLDVPENAVAIAFGLLLQGSGKVWMGGLVLEVVPDTEPTTDMRTKALQKVRNLGFED